MPSPFRRKSGQIQPMSQAELDASLAETEARAAADATDEGVYILPVKRSGAFSTSSNLFTVELTQRSKKSNNGEHAGWEEGEARPAYSREYAEREAKTLADVLHLPYLGER